MKKNGFAPVLIILVIAILGVVGYFAYENYADNKLQISVTSSPNPESSKKTKNTPTSNPSMSPTVVYTPPLTLRPDVVYPGANFVERTEVKPCFSNTMEESLENCYGTLGESGGVRFIYKVQAPFKDVVAWYKTKWHLNGGGGEVADDGESGTTFSGHITEGGSDYLYYIGIDGDKLSTEITFSSNSQTSN